MPAFCKIAMASGPHVVLGSEKRRLLISTDIFLLSAYVGARKVSAELYKLSCCSRVSGPTMESSPLAASKSAADKVGVRTGMGVSVARGINVLVDVNSSVLIDVDISLELAVGVELLIDNVAGKKAACEVEDCGVSTRLRKPGIKKAVPRKRPMMDMPIPRPIPRYLISFECILL